MPAEEDTTGKVSDDGPDDEEDIDLNDDEAAKLLKGAVDEDDDEDDPEGADQLGDAGKRALERIKVGRREARERSAKAEKDLAAARKKISDYEGKNKSVQERLQQELDDAKSELTKERSTRQRREAAEEHAPDEADPKLIRAAAEWIKGDTEEELQKSAEKFYGLFATAQPKKVIPGKPREKLRGGGSSSDEDEEEMDPRKLADMIGRAR